MDENHATSAGQKERLGIVARSPRRDLDWATPPAFFLRHFSSGIFPPAFFLRHFSSGIFPPAFFYIDFHGQAVGALSKAHDDDIEVRDIEVRDIEVRDIEVRGPVSSNVCDG
jgi:hypothetical protein